MGRRGRQVLRDQPPICLTEVGENLPGLDMPYVQEFQTPIRTTGPQNGNVDHFALHEFNKEVQHLG